MSVAAPPITGREQELGAIIAAYNVVTDRLKDAHERLGHEVRRLREELEHKNEELRRSERLAALGEMAAGLAHEVRNPLGGIALQASMLERDLADRPQAAAQAQRIREGVRALDRLVTEVLSFAQEGALERGPVAVTALIQRVLSTLQTCIGRRTCVVVDSPAELTLEGDTMRLERALANLVMNAIQSAGPAGRVTISARASGEDVELKVADDGPGIAPEHVERIFNPFFTTKPDGTGLGLSIVHRIVEAHGGSIRAGNATPRGAVFTLRLPACALETSPGTLTPCHSF